MTSKRAAIVGALPLVVALVLLLVTPALAHHKGTHSKGGGKGSDKAKSSSGFTEDDDENDGGTPNNVADEGDNKHPSGKDRSVEKGTSGTQGNSQSDPDDDGRGPDRSNGGADKPNGPGGDDLADQDGNNGCGNDDDFEDDNEGWCGGKPKKDEAADEVAVLPTTPTKPDKPSVGGRKNDKRTVTVPCSADAVMVKGRCKSVADIDKRRNEDRVLGLRIERPEVGTEAQVLAAAQTAAAAERAAAPLPLTGAALVRLLLLGAALVTLGLVLLRGWRWIETNNIA